jgi:hypothetical protein
VYTFGIRRKHGASDAPVDVDTPPFNLERLPQVAETG